MPRPGAANGCAGVRSGRRGHGLGGYPGKAGRQKHGGREIRSTARVDRQIAFPGAQAGHRFMDRFANIACGHITEQEKTRGIGMPSEIFVIVFAGKNLKRGVFYGVIPPCCKKGREIKDRRHDFIIA